MKLVDQLFFTVVLTGVALVFIEMFDLNGKLTEPIEKAWDKLKDGIYATGRWFRRRYRWVFHKVTRRPLRVDDAVVVITADTTELNAAFEQGRQAGKDMANRLNNLFEWINGVSEGLAGGTKTELTKGLKLEDVTPELALDLAVAKIEQLEENTKWTAQTVHQAYHAEGTWETCEKSVCLAAKQQLGG